jgi:hypothetical protein
MEHTIGDSRIVVKYHSRPMLATVDVNALLATLFNACGGNVIVEFAEMSEQEKAALNDDLGARRAVRRRFQLFDMRLPSGMRRRTDLENCVGTDEWIGVAEVAVELKLTERSAWELIRRLGVPRLEPGRAIMGLARFRRSDWEAARDAAVRPPEPRSRQVRPAAPAPPTLVRQKARTRAEKFRSF